MSGSTVFHKTILVVEDDDTDAVLIERALRFAGAHGPINKARSGNEAIEYLMGEGKYSDRRKYPFPTFIMTDLKMPNGDGFEVLHHLKSNPEWAIIPTVVLSSSQDADDVKKAYMLGASSFHVKPCDFEALRKELKVLQEYWMSCCVPEADPTGRQLLTESKGKLGERFAQLSGSIQTRQPSTKQKL